MEQHQAAEGPRKGTLGWWSLVGIPILKQYQVFKISAHFHKFYFSPLKKISFSKYTQKSSNKTTKQPRT